MFDRSRRVILLIDFDNLQICASRDTPGRDLQLEPVVQLAQRYGHVMVARAYAEWNLSTERLAVYKAGIEPAFAPVLRTESDRSGKSLADTVMVAEGMDLLWTLNPDVMVLATSDKDLIPLVRVAKQRGCRVVVLGSDFTAIPLREMADEHITYKQLVTDAAGRYLEGPTLRTAAAPEPVRRSRIAREGREARAPLGTAAPSATPPAPASPAAAGAGAASPTTGPAAPTPAASTPAEPVPPITAGSEADGQVSTRRRRRRGSRRRSDRVGVPGEHEDDGEDAGSGSGPAEAVLPQPNGNAVAAEPGAAAPERGADATPAEPHPDLGQPERPAATAPADVAPADVAAPPEGAAPAPPAPPVSTTAAAPDSASGADGHDGAGAPSAEAVAPTGGSAPVERAETEASTPSNGTADNGTAEATGATEEPAPPKRTRARRVASASRGRSRPVKD
jgi:uncharacterized protein (TIGR00288 family)